MIVHLLPYKSRHHVRAKVKDFSSLIPQSDQVFVVFGSGDNPPLAEDLNKEVVYARNISDLIGLFLRYGYRSDTSIVLHGFSVTFFLLGLTPFLRARLKWVVWGTGLEHGRINLERKLQYLGKRFLYGKMYRVNCVTSADARILIQEFGLSPDRVTVIPYKMTSHQTFTREQVMDKWNVRPIEILVGNQATRAHNHTNLLKALSKFKEDDIRVHMFLSYPKNEEYVKELTETGQSLFGSKIYPVIELISSEDYFDFMKRVHITIIDVKKQTGLAAIHTTIDYGGIVFLNREGLNKEWLNSLGIKSGNTDEISEFQSAKELCFLSTDEIMENIDRRKKLLDIDGIRNEWKAFLYG